MQRGITDNATASTLVTSRRSPNDTSTDRTEQSLLIVSIVFLCIISLVGIIGNVMIWKMLIQRKRKSSEYFIMNLAVADLTVCAMGIPLEIYEQLHDTWQFGVILCKMIWPYQTLLVLVSIMTLTAMSLERYRAIMTPFKPRLKKSHLLKAMALIWIIGLCVVAPYVKILNYDGEKCQEEWPTKMSGAYYTLSLLVIDYCIPLTIIAYCYARAGFKLYENTKQFKQVTGASEVQNFAQRKRHRRNTRAIKIFSFAVLMFLVCMLPGDCYWMWKSFGGNSTFAYENHFKTFSNILLYANSAINPFIFGACHLGCTRELRRSHHRGLQRVISFQSQESSSHLPPNSYKKDDSNNDESTKLNLNIYDCDHLRETDV